MELNSNPDEFGSTSKTDDEPFEDDLFNPGPVDDGFLPLALEADLATRVDEFWELSNPQGSSPDVGPWRPDGDCPLPYRQWPICDGAGDCLGYP